MSHSIVKVTENLTDDSLILVIGEDGTVTPDKETVESYLRSKGGTTELQVMHVNKIDGQSIDVTLDTLMYVHSEEVIEEPSSNMDELARNLLNFRMDHDYTPLTSPKRETSTTKLDDELAQTLSILEGSDPKPVQKTMTKIMKVNTKPIKKPPPSQSNRQRTKMITMIPTPLSKQLKPLIQKPTSTPKPKPVTKQEVESDELDEQDSDFDIEFEDDDSDSDFEIEESVKAKFVRKMTPKRRTKLLTEPVTYPKAKPKVKPVKSDLEISPKPLQEPLQEPKTSPIEKKPPPKKEKKVSKPPEDFALFSTPDIIRRVGGKDPVTPTTPTTLTLNPMQMESLKTPKPAKILQENRSKSTSSETPKVKRVSTDQSPFIDKDKKRDRKLSASEKSKVVVQGYDESVGSNSSESLLDSQLDPLPSAEDIRAIIQNESTKSFTTSLMIPETGELEQGDQNQVNLESGGLDLDQSILDNINTDLISEDILYQVAQSLVDNPELQNVIDKSIVDGNLMLDASLQQAMAQEQNIPQQNQPNNLQNVSSVPEIRSTSPTKGTQIIRSDGRVVVIPPIERPATRSRNKRHGSQEVRQVSRSDAHKSLAKKNVRPIKPLDEEHVSGNELDSSDEETDEDESEDDPNKLWCICNQPHNNRFMICCDTCEEWYHGKCVNVTKAMGQMMEQEGKEWICLYCKDPSLKRPSAAARRIRKASRTSTDSASSQRKSSTTSLTEAVTTPACIVCGKPSRNSSIYCSDSCILKHAQGVEKVVVFERKSGRILSGANAPSAANLDSWLHEHPGFEVVRSTSKPSAVKKLNQSKLQIVKNPANDGISLTIQRKGINIGALPHAPKQTLQQDNLLKDKVANAKELQSKLHKKITGLKIISRQVSLNQPKTKLIQPVPITKASVLTPTPVAKAKVTQAKIVPTTPPIPKEKPMPQKTPKARQAEVNAQPQQENIRENVKKTLMEQLMNRIKMVDDLKLIEEEVAQISSEIETQLFKCFGDTGQKYRNRYRSLIFNIKDVKNQTLWRKICEKSINPYQLVRLSPDDLASQELALWREREAKHQLDMIKKSELELLSCNRQFVFKTHKGEQVFEDDRPKDQTVVTEVITGLGADSTSTENEDGKRDGSKEGERKSSKHKKDRGKDKERKSSREKIDSKEKRREPASKDRDKEKEKERDRRKLSRSREHGAKHNEKKRSRSRERDRHRHKSSRHNKKDVHSTTDKLDNKSKEILKQLVDKQIVPPLEDRLWKHVPQEDIVPVSNAESDSDHEPSSTVTIPTPPRTSEPDEVSPPVQTVPEFITEIVPVAEKSIVRTTSVDSNELFSPKDNDSSGLSPVLRTQTEHVWKGTINMVDVAQISITAHEVSGDCNGLSEELPTSLDIVGRISPDTVWEYIGKMRCSNSKIISLLRLNATNMEEKMPYIALYSYLSSRNRLGVVKSPNKAVKDFYILPLASQKPIPQALLPISGPGFEESRPPLLLGIIVRDKRKRSYVDAIQPVTSKRTRVDVAVIPSPAAPTTPPISTPTLRSYTPPPSRDPRLKSPYIPPSTSLPSPPPTTPSLTTPPSASEIPIDDMDEPYSPEDSDPETVAPLQKSEPPRLSTAKPRSFLETTQTFKPFSNKFDSIPGLDDASSLPASSQELQRKMAELDQRIAMQKAELHNMSQNIASAEIGTSALANIALPSNLQQILDSIKTIRAATSDASEPQTTIKNAAQGGQTDLTIPLMLPKISSRSLVGAQKHDASSPTIPLNLPKSKVKQISATNSPQHFSDVDKSGSSVLSLLSEEDLIRKANEMLGETSASTGANKKQTFSSYISSSVMYTPPVPPPIISPQQKRLKIDLNQPPIPGLEDEC